MRGIDVRVAGNAETISYLDDDLSEVYKKAEIDSLLSDLYTSAEVDQSLLDLKKGILDQADTTYAKVEDVYTQAEVAQAVAVAVAALREDVESDYALAENVYSKAGVDQEIQLKCTDKIQLLQQEIEEIVADLRDEILDNVTKRCVCWLTSCSHASIGLKTLEAVEPLTVSALLI